VPIDERVLDRAFFISKPASPSLKLRADSPPEGDSLASCPGLLAARRRARAQDAELRVFGSRYGASRGRGDERLAERLVAMRFHLEAARPALPTARSQWLKRGAAAER